MKTEPSKGRRARGGAFTLVELLVVIAIITILAGLTLAVLPGVMKSRNLSRLKAEHGAVVSAIENYKSSRGYYPPGNPRSVTNAPLLYELKGVTYLPGPPEEFVYGSDPALNTNQLGMYLGVAGIANAAPAGAAERATDYFPAMSFKMSDDIAGTPNKVRVRRLVSGVLGDDGEHLVFKYNVTTTDRNNPESFDLWAEYVFRGKTNVVANW